MRLVQLTALAYCIGFLTDVFDDGASAKMDEADGTSPGRHIAADNLDDAVSAPAPDPTTTTSVSYAQLPLPAMPCSTPVDPN